MSWTNLVADKPAISTLVTDELLLQESQAGWKLVIDVSLVVGFLQAQRCNNLKQQNVVYQRVSW